MLVPDDVGNKPLAICGTRRDRVVMHSAASKACFSCTLIIFNRSAVTGTKFLALPAIRKRSRLSDLYISLYTRAQGVKRDMVNLTYGILNEKANFLAQDTPAGFITSNGTDLIATDEDGNQTAYSPGDIAWVLTCTALVWIMIPGLGFLYSGLVRRKNALALLLLTLICMASISFTWWFWGYSLAFSENSSSFIGDLHNFCFMHVLERPAAGANNKIPQIVYAIYQNMFAALVPAIAIGAAAEHGRVAPVMPFLFCWVTLVYCPIVAAIWNPNGWAFKWGVYDYAGGVPVEVCSGTTGLAYSLFLGRRRGYGTPRLAYKPHNVSHVVIGTVLLWFGWLGFNGGSTFAANLKAAMAITVTNLAGSTGAMTWLVMDYRLERKWSVVGFCTGAIVGLVAITPAAGYVGTPAGALIGAVASAVCNMATSLKGLLRVDDVCDIFAAHGIAGMVGLIMVGIFAQQSVAFNDAVTQIDGGWLDGNWVQLPIQLAWIAFGFGWTFVMTLLIMFVIDKIPGFHFKADEVGEIIGMDEASLGEFAYDFVEATRDLQGDYSQEYSSDDFKGHKPIIENNLEVPRSSSKETDATKSTGPAETDANEKGVDSELAEKVARRRQEDAERVQNAGLDQRGAPTGGAESGGI